MRLILTLAFAGLLAVAIVAYARAHNAPSGWPYPAECCSGQDCHEIDEGELQRNPDGSYTVEATGETFYDPVTARHMEDRFATAAHDSSSYTPGGYYVRAYKWSGDGAYHRCAKTKDGYTFCLFIPMPAA